MVRGWWFKSIFEKCGVMVWNYQMFMIILLYYYCCHYYYYYYYWWPPCYHQSNPHTSSFKNQDCFMPTFWHCVWRPHARLLHCHQCSCRGAYWSLSSECDWPLAWTAGQHYGSIRDTQPSVALSYSLYKLVWNCKLRAWGLSSCRTALAPRSEGVVHLPPIASVRQSHLRPGCYINVQELKFISYECWASPW